MDPGHQMHFDVNVTFHSIKHRQTFIHRKERQQQILTYLHNITYLSIVFCSETNFYDQWGFCPQTSHSFKVTFQCIRNFCRNICYCWLWYVVSMTGCDAPSVSIPWQDSCERWTRSCRWPALLINCTFLISCTSSVTGFRWLAHSLFYLSLIFYLSKIVSCFTRNMFCEMRYLSHCLTSCCINPP